MLLTRWRLFVGIMTRNTMAFTPLMNITARKSATVKPLIGLSQRVINRTESLQIVLNLSLLLNFMVILTYLMCTVLKKVLIRLNLVNVGLMIWTSFVLIQNERRTSHENLKTLTIKLTVTGIPNQGWKIRITTRLMLQGMHSLMI